MRHRQPQWLAQRDDLPHTLGINDLEGDESQRLLIHIEFAGCTNQMAQVTDEKLKHVASRTVHPSGSIGIDGRQSACIHSNVQQRACASVVPIQVGS